MKVVVAGAGIAGLAAAWELKQNGRHEVLVLESERVNERYGSDVEMSLMFVDESTIAELNASATAVARRLHLSSWRVAYQSAGATPEPWLRPDAGDVVIELSRAGHNAILLVPIGFVCDHVEILYDIDVEYQALAKRLGVQLERTASLNDDPGLVGAVADDVRIAAAERGWL